MDQTGSEVPDAAAADAYSQIVIGVAEQLTPRVAALRVRRSEAGRAGEAAGSAVVLTRDGHLLTNAHVVEGADGAQAGQAAFADGTVASFDVIGRDPLSDLAVVRADRTIPDPPEYGDADQLKVGSLVVAVGNPLGLAGSVTAGVVSALGRAIPARTRRASRIIENVIQTDAALHPGNSGGALADAAAEVVGVNTAVVGPWVGQGLGLAVPINTTTREIIGALMTHGRVRRAYLGVAGGPRPLPPRLVDRLGRRRGLEVVSVVGGSPAALAGLRPEDLVVQMDGVPIEGVGDLQRLMTHERIGIAVPVVVVRNGREMTIDVRLTELGA